MLGGKEVTFYLLLLVDLNFLLQPMILTNAQQIGSHKSQSRAAMLLSTFCLRKVWTLVG